MNLVKNNINLIINGFGISSPSLNNPLTQSKMPNLNYLWQNFSSGFIDINHPNLHSPFQYDKVSKLNLNLITSGKNIPSALSLLKNSMLENTLVKNPIFVSLCSAKKIQVFFYLNTLEFELLNYLIKNIASKNENSKISLNITLDSSTNTKEKLIQEFDKIDNLLKLSPNIELSSICGNEYTDNHDLTWEKTKIFFDFFIYSNFFFTDYRKIILNHFDKHKNLSNLTPFFYNKANVLKDSDTLFFFNAPCENFEQLNRAFNEQNFQGWAKKQTTAKPTFELLKNFETTNYIINENSTTDSAVNFLEENQLSQIFIQENDKLELIKTFFVKEKGKRERIQYYTLQDSKNFSDSINILQLANIFDNLSNSNQFEFINIYLTELTNIARLGNIELIKKNITLLDSLIGKLAKYCIENNSLLTIFSDHGSIESMNSNFSTLNPVPILFVKKELPKVQLTNIALSSIFPTIFSILKIDRPYFFESKSIF